MNPAGRRRARPNLGQVRTERSQSNLRPLPPGAQVRQPRDRARNRLEVRKRLGFQFEGKVAKG
jgi:hypothetical protein